MTELELRQVFIRWTTENDFTWGDMSNFSDNEVKFMCFVGGYNFAMSLRTQRADDGQLIEILDKLPVGKNHE